MKNIELLRNPFLKIAGLGLILYFGLFHNKESPESLGNRLSKENVKKNFDQIQEKAKFISSNLKMAQKVSKGTDVESNSLPQDVESNSLPQESPGKIVNNSNPSGEVLCGDLVLISYDLYQGNKNLVSIAEENITIGNGSASLMEKNIIGMRVGDSKIIPLVKGNGPKKIVQSLEYHIKILSISGRDEKTYNASCLSKKPMKK